ncbi:DEAD/DEAH box helicase family protein [Bacillus cereus]
MKRNYITDVITKENVEDILQPGFSLIASPTGTGKSTFIINQLIKPMFENKKYGFGHGKYHNHASANSLLLSNRTAVRIKTEDDVIQLCKQIEAYDSKSVDVSSYQKVSTTKDTINAITEADIVICDEAHYFIADAWNLTTVAIMAKLIEVSKFKPVILFTATPQLIHEYFNSRKMYLNAFLDYRKELGWEHRMDFMCSNKPLREILKNIPKGEKWLVFVEDAKARGMIENLCKELQEEGYSVEYYHSMWEKVQFGIFRGEKVPEMEKKIGILVQNKCFETQGALANKAIDNGIDLKDKDLKHIILLNQFDHVQIQQMVGRKRFDVDDENDRLTVWFTTESKGILKRTLGRLNDSIDICVKYKNYHDKMVDKFRETTKSDFELNEISYTDEKLEDVTLEKVYKMFLERYEDEEMYERIAKLKLNRYYLQNEHYVGLLIFQRKYIIPLLIENHVEEKDITGNWEIIKKKDIVRNYQILVRELFDRPSKIEWSSSYDNKKQEFTNRVANELQPYLESLEGVQLMNETKREFEEQISYYFGASKKSDRLVSLANIKKFIHEHGFTVKDDRKTINKKKTTIWAIEKI